MTDQPSGQPAKPGEGSGPDDQTVNLHASEAGPPAAEPAAPAEPARSEPAQSEPAGSEPAPAAAETASPAEAPAAQPAGRPAPAAAPLQPVPAGVGPAASTRSGPPRRPGRFRRWAGLRAVQLVVVGLLGLLIGAGTVGIVAAAAWPDRHPGPYGLRHHGEHWRVHGPDGRGGGPWRDDGGR